MCYRKISTILSLLFLFLLPLQALAIPAYLSHQGHILDSNNQPLTGVVSMTFTFYDSATGGSDVWNESLDVSFDDGFYSVVLGTDTNNPLLQDYFDGSDRYLGITVDENGEMAPRSMVTSVPYAMLAGAVQGEVNATDGIITIKKQ